MQWLLCSFCLLIHSSPAAALAAHSCALPDDTSLIQGFRSRRQGQQQSGRQQIVHKQRHHASRDHGRVIFDTSDYRDDAAMYLKQALALQGGSSIKSRCGGLTQMSLAEVEEHWRRWRQAAVAEATEKGEKDMELVDGTARRSFNAKLDGNRPVVVQDVVGQLAWPAANQWGPSQMVERMSNQIFDLHSFDYPHWIIPKEEKETLGEYLNSNQSAQNLFLFASETKTGSIVDSAIVDVIRHDFAPHPNFAYPPEAKRAIFAIDAIGSSHGFHNHDPVWQAQVEGYKMWYLLPPDAPASEDRPSSNPHARFAPLAGGKPFEHPNACAMLTRFVPPPGTLTCLVAPGEMILLPDQWLHATCGLSNYTAAAGGWLGLSATVEHRAEKEGSRRRR